MSMSDGLLLVTEKKSECESNNSINNFSSVIVHGLFQVENNNCAKTSNVNVSKKCGSTTTTTPASASAIQGLPGIANKENDSNLISTLSNGNLKEEQEELENEQQQQYNYLLQVESPSSASASSSNFNSLSLTTTTYSSLEGGTSYESASNTNTTVSFLTEIEIIPFPSLSEQNLCSLENDERSTSLTTMESNEEGGPLKAASLDDNEASSSTLGEANQASNSKQEPKQEQGESSSQQQIDHLSKVEQEETGTTTTEEEGDVYYEDDGDRGEGREGDDEEDEDTTTLSSEAVVDDIELILMPEMCHDLPSSNLSPKLVRVTELKVNIDDVFCDDDDDDEDQSGRHDFRSIVDEVCEEDEHQHQDDIYRRRGNNDDYEDGEDGDDVSSGSELITSNKKGASCGGGGGGLESSKSSSSSGSRRRRSTSGRINSGVQTDITALEEPSALSGYRRKSSGKSSSGGGRLGLPSGGKKLNWKSELTLLPSKMKVKQAGFNSFESNDERDQYSPRVAKFTSQDTLNLSSQFLKPSTLYRTRNLSRNLNQFASSESTFMLPMSSEQQLSAESPRFRDRVSSSTSGCNFKGGSTSHSYSAYQISSILSGRDGGGGVSGGGGMGMGYGGGGFGGGGALGSARRHHQPLSSGYSGGMMMMSSSSSRNFRSSMPDLNAMNNKSYASGTMGDSHRRRHQPSSSKSIKHHHPFSSGFRLQKRSSSDEETSSLIDESERCLRSSIDLLLTDELPSPGGDSCFRSTNAGFGSSSLAATSTGFYSSRRSCSQPILNDMAYPPEMKDPSMGSPFLPRKLSDMRCSRWAKVILPNGHVAIVSVKETDEIQDSLTVHTDTGCVINLPFRKVVFAWKSKR